MRPMTQCANAVFKVFVFIFRGEIGQPIIFLPQSVLVVLASAAHILKLESVLVIRPLLTLIPLLVFHCLVK